jgi:hypothetical protein
LVEDKIVPNWTSRTLFALALFSNAVAHATPVMIDSFDVTGQFISVGPGGTNPLSSSSGTATAAGEALGGFRNIEIERLTGVSFNFATVGSGLFAMNLAADETGISRITWDGDTNNTLDHGLAADLTSLGTNNRIQLGIRSDLPGTVSLIVYSGASNYSTATFSAPALGFGAQPFTLISLPFAGVDWVATGLGADFTSVSAIRLVGDGSSISSASLDMQLSFIEANSSIPEPGTFGLIGMALCGLAAVRIRGKR